MRLLFLTSRLPYPPHRGDRLRTFQLLRHLGQDHSVTLLSFCETPAEMARSSELGAYCAEIQVLLRTRRTSIGSAAFRAWRSQPLQVSYYESEMMGRTVEQLTAERRFDAAYVHLFRMAPYLRAHPEIYRILDLCDLVSMEMRRSLPFQTPIRRAIMSVEQARVAEFERHAAAWYDEVWFASRYDASRMSAAGRMPEIQVIPNGVDPRLLEIVRRPAEQPVVLFVGNFDVFHNVVAARELAALMPLVRKHTPLAVLRLVGAGELKAVRDLAHSPGVELAGFVPDLALAYSSATVAAAPMRFSAGTQFKALEAMAAALPVVTTPAVAEAVGADSNSGLLTAESREDFARQIVRLIKDPALNHELGVNGREFARREFTWNTAVARLHELEARLRG